MNLRRWFALAAVASLLLLAACGDDEDTDTVTATDTPTSAAPAGTEEPEDKPTATAAVGSFEQFSTFAGQWEGVWNNTTTGSTAGITMTITVNEDGTASFTLDLADSDTGAPFGQPAPATKTFAGTYDESGLTVEVVGDDFFGDMTVTIAPDGQLTVEATMDPLPGVDGLTVGGTLTAKGLAFIYRVTFPDRSDATGTAQLERP